ncbi:MAG: hypothetical protein KDG89_11850 [Geminicoccaceae bacterium]|nr:hypothetical protein [Geminicoccaceae bacterium]
MRKLALTLALAFGLGAVAAPAFACGWKNQTTAQDLGVQLPKTTAQTPIPSSSDDRKG